MPCADDAQRRFLTDLYRREEKALYNIVYRWVWNEQDAVDIVQEAFLAFWRHRNRMEPGNEKPYLFRCALNLAANRCRRTKILRFIGLDKEPASAEKDPEAELLLSESRARVRSAFAKLSESHKKVLMLGHFSGLSHESIATTLGIAVGTVGSRLNRAQKKLKLILEDS